MKPCILVLSADAQLRATLARWLMVAGYRVELAEGAKRAHEVLRTESPALAILEAGPAEAGPDLAAELRDSCGGLIVVGEPAEPTGPLYADVRISVPLNEEEVLARVKAALADQAEPSSLAILNFDGYTLDPGRRTCTAPDGSPVPLTRAEFRLLQELARQPGRVLSRSELSEAVAGRMAQPDDRSVDVLISRLRRKIEPDPREPRIIVTVPGKGYRFGATVSARTADVPCADSPVMRATAGASDARTSAPAAPLAATTRASVSRRAWIAPAALAVAAIVVMAIAFRLLRPGTPAAGSQEMFDAAVVPFVSDTTRIGLIGYLQRPDYKALAVSNDGQIGLSFGARDLESAKSEALQRCTVQQAQEQPGWFCRIYAAGSAVAWSPKSIPMPLAADMHAEPLDQSLVAGEIPVWTAAVGTWPMMIATYLGSAPHGALAVNPDRLRLLWKFAEESQADAVRTALESCGDVFQSACLLMAVDDSWTIRLPRSRRITGLFMLTTAEDMSEQERARIGEIYRQKEWRALARGSTGKWYPVANAPSEAAAIQGALDSCVTVERQCSLYAIGNFRVAE